MSKSNCKTLIILVYIAIMVNINDINIILIDEVVFNDFASD